MAITTVDKTRISVEQLDILEAAIVDRGFDDPHEFVTPPRTIETDVPCPVCGSHLPFCRWDNSYQIKCHTDGCIDIVLRGF